MAKTQRARAKRRLQADVGITGTFLWAAYIAMGFFILNMMWMLPSSLEISSGLSSEGPRVVPGTVESGHVAGGLDVNVDLGVDLDGLLEDPGHVAAPQELGEEANDVEWATGVAEAQAESAVGSGGSKRGSTGGHGGSSSSAALVTKPVKDAGSYLPSAYLPRPAEWRSGGGAGGGTEEGAMLRGAGGEGPGGGGGPEEEADGEGEEEEAAEESWAGAPEDRSLGEGGAHSWTAKYEGLMSRLRKTPAILSKKRLDHKSSHISCGGTGVVQFRSWQAVGQSAAGLVESLPLKEPPLPGLARALYGDCRRKPDGKCSEVGLKRGGRAARCAVVGNSGKLRYELHRDEIDAADIVIRFNSGKTKGFEKHVGTKSTFRMYNGPYVQPKQDQEVTVAQLRDPATRAWVKALDKAPRLLAYMFDPEFLCLAWDFVGREGDKPSSGMVGVLFGLSMCQFVDVYGYQPSGYFNHTVMPHYYDWERPKVGREKAHPFETEQEVYKILEAAGKLKMH